MRVIKEPEVRKSEILDEAERLFTVKGFEETTVNDILEKTSIAKGTFYYYFKSKEDALNEIINRRIDGFAERAIKIISDPSLDVHAKLFSVIMTIKPQNPAQKEFTPVLHEQGNAQFHQKSLINTLLRLTPILKDIIEEGNEQRIFNTPYPKESVEILLSAAIVLFDDGFFIQQPQEAESKVNAFIIAMERILGAKPGSMEIFRKAVK